MINVEMVPIKSSNLKEVGYDEKEKTLYVGFLSGSLYSYFDVEKEIYIGLLNADSHGKYFDRYVKKAGYKYKKLIKNCMLYE